MVVIKKKLINGHEYLYAEYSFRLPDSTIKKISKLIKNKSEVAAPAVKKYFLEREKDENMKYVIAKYHADSIFTPEQIKSIECIRVEYKHLKNLLTKKQLADIIDRFTVNFTYESNAIEGNSLTLKDVTLILNENIVPRNKDLREVYETKNTRIVNGLLFNNKIKITADSIIKVHSLLVRDTDVAIGYKKLPNFLLMRNVKTTPPENVEKEMSKLISWYANNKDKVHPLKLASEFHARFERIHPFEDGNGRTGRVLLNAILVENNLPPLIIRKTMRSAYFSALEAADSGHLKVFERFMLNKFKRTFDNFFRIYVKYL